MSSTEQTMIEVRADRFGGPDVLRAHAAAIPTAGPGQVVVRVHSAAVNFSDVVRRRASAYPFPTGLPYVPGSEVAGTVASLGEGVDGLAADTPVFALVGESGEGGYAQFAVADARQVFPIPAGLDRDVAAGLLVAGATAILIVRDFAAVKPGETIFVPAAVGGVGSVAVQFAKHLGARVIGGASTEAKRQLAVQLGADSVVDTAGDWPAALRAAAPEGVDVVLDMAGGTSLERALGCLGPFGRAVVYGNASDQTRTLSQDALDRWLSTPALNQRISAFNLGTVFRHRPELGAAAVQTLLECVMAGEIRPRMGFVLPLSQAARAHRLLETRRSIGKIVLRPWLDDQAPDAVRVDPMYLMERPATGVLALRWSAATARMNSEQFKDGILALGEATVTHRPRGLLVDLRSFGYDGPGVGAWRDEVVLPMYVSGGATKMAYIIPSSWPAGPPDTDGALAERSFVDEDTAIAWLREED